MLTPLDDKLNAAFPGKCVRKDLTARVRGNAVVPTYVLEYLLGQYCSSDDELTIESGVESVKKILAKHYVHREEAELIKSKILDLGSFRVIDRLAVEVDDRKGIQVAAFTNLGLSKVPLSSEISKEHPKLLTGGVWCLVDVEYHNLEDKTTSPWTISRVKPIQMSNFDVVEFLEARARFTVEEWMDVLLQSIGFNPEHFSRRQKLIQLTRLIPFAERNYNLIELGPKGTGKSHVFSEFSPHGMLISGGEVTLPKLFVNNTSNKIGLVGYWDSVAFDEFAGSEKKVPQNLVDVMKNYMANKTFSRGREMLGAEASMVFIGNTKRSVGYMLKHSDLFEPLPRAYYDTAFLDRLHHYLPGWEVSIIRGEMFTKGFGFIVDYLAEVFRHMRREDFGGKYKAWFELDPTIATRDRTAITKTFSGLMKVLYPSGECSKEEARELLEWSLEGRRRVKLQLMKMDETFRETDIRFAYRDLGEGRVVEVDTLEEAELSAELGQFPDARVPKKLTPSVAVSDANAEQVENPELPPTSDAPASPASVAGSAKTQELDTTHLSFREGQRGVSFERLFGPYLNGAKEIHVQDPYLRNFYQVRNLAEFCQFVYRLTPPGDETTIKVWTKPDDLNPNETEKLFMKLQMQLQGTRVALEYIILPPEDSTHDRYIETDTGWKCILGRGLDVFQRFESKETFSLAANVQEERQVKAFEVTWLKV